MRRRRKGKEENEAALRQAHGRCGVAALASACAPPPLRSPTPAGQPFPCELNDPAQHLPAPLQNLVSAGSFFVFFAFSFERERLLKVIPRCSTRCFFLLCITGFEMTSFSVLQISLPGVTDEVTSASSNRWSGVTTAISTSKHVCLLAAN